MIKDTDQSAGSVPEAQILVAAHVHHRKFVTTLPLLQKCAGQSHRIFWLKFVCAPRKNLNFIIKILNGSRFESFLSPKYAPSQLPGTDANLFILELSTFSFFSRMMDIIP